MQDKIEAVAEALYERDREGWLEKHPDDFFIHWGDTAFEPFREQWRDEARVALEAAALASIDKVRADALEARLIEAAETKGFLSVEDIRDLSKQEK